MKAFIFGASGIIGQHMILSKPPGIIPYFFRGSIQDPQKQYGPYQKFNGDLTSPTQDNLIKLLVAEKPDVIVNLAGENRVDVVEQDPRASHFINVEFPKSLANLSKHSASSVSRFIQVSTQGVFSGDNPTYEPTDTPHPITQYGKQKLQAEEAVLRYGGNIARVTFVLGVRPFQNVGRPNPLETMFKDLNQHQVNDRWFSPAFANDVAEQLWTLVLNSGYDQIVHIGEPIRMSRYNIAMNAVELWQMTEKTKYPELKAVSHTHFEGIAPRPRDTTWAYGSMHSRKFEENLLQAYVDWNKFCRNTN